MKKLINRVADIVPDMLEGMALGNPGIALLQDHTVAVRADVQAMNQPMQAMSARAGRRQLSA